MGLFRNLGPLSKLGGSISTRLSAVPVPSMVARPIGIDFGCGALKVLQLNDQNPPGLVAAGCIETPRELMGDIGKRLEFQVSALPKLIRHGGFKGKRAVCAIPSWQMICRHFQLQRQEGVSLAALVEAAIPTQLNCDPATVLHRYFEVGKAEKGGKAEVVVIATPRELVNHLMQAMVHSKLQPVGIHTEFVAVLRAFDHIHRREADAHVNTLYLDIGAATTKVIVSHGTELAFARVIEVGGKHMDETLAKQMKCEVEEARRQRLATGATVAAEPKLQAVAAGVDPAKVAPAAPAPVPEGERPERRGSGGPLPGFSADVLSQPTASLSPERGDLTEAMEILTDEVSMCLRYHAGQFPGRKVERVVFVGGESRQRGLCQQVARRLKLPAHMADPMARVARTGTEPALGVDMKQAQPGWAVALGLCTSPTDL